MSGVPRRVVVLGGANVDVVARSSCALDPGSSTPGVVTVCDGGVGRNVAENLARLGSPVALVTAFGADDDGAAMRTRCEAAGIDVTYAVRSRLPSSRYVAVLYSSGELVHAVSDMRGIDTLSAADITPALRALRASDLVVVDANLPTGVLSAVAAAAHAVGAPVVAEPVSVAKAPRLMAALSPRPWLITPNLDELSVLSDKEPPGPGTAREEWVLGGAEVLISSGCRAVWVRAGAAGSWLFEPSQRQPVHTPTPPSEVVDVTGAGDALLAGFLHARLGGADLREAVAFGHAVAAVTVADRHTVRPDLNAALAARALLAGGTP